MQLLWKCFAKKGFLGWPGAAMRKSTDRPGVVSLDNPKRQNMFQIAQGTCIG